MTSWKMQIQKENLKQPVAVFEILNKVRNAPIQHYTIQFKLLMWMMLHWWFIKMFRYILYWKFIALKKKSKTLPTSTKDHKNKERNSEKSQKGSPLLTTNTKSIKNLFYFLVEDHLPKPMHIGKSTKVSREYVILWKNVLPRFAASIV